MIAEDTRVTKTLLAHYGISTPLVAYHEHNARVMRPHLIARLESGAALALVSDAGTPLVSDPGFKLVSEALEKGIKITSVPGPSAVLAALVVAGLPTDRFFSRASCRIRAVHAAPASPNWRTSPARWCCSRVPRRLAETLADALAVLGPRDAAIARELTKIYESVRRGTLDELSSALAQEEPPKGEIVLLIAPPAAGAELLGEAELDAQIEAALAAHSVKDAASVVAGKTGQPRRQVYARALQLAADRTK